MSSARKKHQKVKDARKKLDDIFDRPDTVVVIHYSCESFYDRNDGTSARITSIAVRNLDNAQTKSFSIHHEAERAGVPFADIEAKFDKLEKRMLDEFYAYVRKRDNYRWLHWNMRNSNYGFEALAHRYRLLKGEPPDIPEAQRYDLSRILFDIYGAGYTDHPRLESLIEMNHITKRDFLTGSEEAVAFDNREYVRLHLSTLRKVDILANIASQAWAKELDTKNPGWKRAGLNVEAWIELVTDHLVFRLLGILIVLYGTYEALQALGLF